MPPTGVAVMVVLAVGVGAFLYYIFADNQHQYGNEGGYSPPPRENPNSWANSHNDSYSKPRRRKRGSSVGTGKSSCTICLAELADKESVLLSCKHEFHEACIKKWREQGPSEARNTCPNCREDIIGSSAWN